jgi:hypothetical protein
MMIGWTGCTVVLRWIRQRCAVDYANGAADLPTSGHEIKRLNRGRGNLRVDRFLTFKGDSFTGVGQSDWGAGPVQDEWAAVEQNQRSGFLSASAKRSIGWLGRALLGR